MLTKVPDFPLPATDIGSDYTLLYGSISKGLMVVLVYEVTRNFLSAPRTFAVAEFQLNNPGDIELDSDTEFEGAEYDELGRMAETGVFAVNAVVNVIDGEVQEESQHLVISLAEQRIELLAEAAGVTGQYISRTAREALSLYLKDQES